MFKTNDYLTQAMIILLIHALVALLYYYLGASTQFGLMLLGSTFGALFLGMLIRLTLGYLNPSDILFKHRYTLEGIGFGLLMASVIFVIGSAISQHFGTTLIVLSIIFGTFLGKIWTNSAEHKKLKKRIDDFPELNSEAFLLSDSGSLTSSAHSETKGLITLTKHEIIFNPAYDVEQKERIALSDIKPQLNKSWVGVFKIPTGIQLTTDQTIEPDKFPRYWLEKIKALSR